MRVIIVCIIFSISLFGVTINFSKPFELELKPNTLQAQISVMVTKSSEKEAAKLLGKFSTFIDSATEVEKKGGNYNIYPQYNYEDNKRYKSDYIGRINYHISSKSPEKLNSFIADLYAQKSDNRTNISTSSIMWVMSEDMKSGKIDGLRLDAILWADKYALSLSKSLSKKCEVKKISFDNSDNFEYVSSARMSKLSAPVPTQDLQKISIKPSFELECK